MYLSVLMVKDNYGQFQNIANALVEDKIASTYTWILQCLMKATDNIVPKAFWTDSELGLINAVSQIFLTMPHFYCLFHIWQNIIKNLKSKLELRFHTFSKAFYSCRNVLSIELFEQRWVFMINEFPESLNSASTLCDIAETIDKRHQEEFKYCQLTDIKVKYTPIGLPHLSSQFFSSVDAIIVKFLSPFILSLQRYQISQSFTYEGQLTSYLFENLQAETIDDNFIEEVVDKPQITLKAILDGIDTSNIIEVWRIIRIGDDILNNSPVLTALESSTEVNTTSRTVDFTLQSPRQLQGSYHKENAQRIIPQKNRFSVAFSTAKTAINIALETGSDTELVKLLKDFILNKQRSCDGDGIESEIINVVVESNSQIVSLQENLINQTTNLYVTKI
ncbi:unnamed protein product [Rhizophagus irregularis]|nr:unnamed protein product [Rhizophagus irregularis]